MSGPTRDGRSVVDLGYTWVGELAEANAYLPIFRGIGTPIDEEVQTLRYVELQTLFDDYQGHGTRRYSKGHYLAELSDAAIEAYLARGVDPAAAGTDWSRVPGGGLELHGGAVADVADEDSAYSGRGALLEWSGATKWSDPAEDEARLAAARAYGTAMESFADGVYVNMLADEGEAGVRRAYRSDKLARLTALKRTWDPDNVFHLNQNIPPG